MKLAVTRHVANTATFAQLSYSLRPIVSPPADFLRKNMTTHSKHSSDLIVQSIRDFSAIGAALLRLWPKSKKAIEQGWNNAPSLNGERFELRRQANENIGIRLGEPSKTQFGFLAALDFDVKTPGAEPEARETLQRHCPNYEELPSVISGSGGFSRHYYLFSATPLESWVIEKGDGWELAVKGTGTYVVAPGSIHPDTGRPYVWERRLEADLWELIQAPDVDLTLLQRPSQPMPKKPADPIEFDRLAKALEAIDPASLGYEDWRNSGMALHHETGGSTEALEIWDAWSKRDPRPQNEGYPGRRTIEMHWRGFGKQRNRQPITGATLLKMAQMALSEALLDELDELADLPTEDTGSKSDVPGKKEGDPLADFELTEGGVAKAFSHAYKNKLKFCHTIGKWYVWTGSHWRREETRLAFHWCRKMCQKVRNTSPDAKAAAKALGRHNTATGVERFAQADPAFAVQAEQWDPNPWLLGTPDGTVNLKTGELKPAQQSDFVTKLATAGPIPLEEFDPDQHCPRWLDFLRHATGQDEEVIRFLGQWAGYCLTGDTREEALLFVHGPGGSGKSTFINTLAAVVGDYARSMETESLTAQRHARHSTEIARLTGVRLAYASETEAGKAWAENRIKQLTGGDTMVARFMRQDDFEFKPQLKLTIVGNNRPTFEKLDSALRRRFNVLAFDQVPAQPDHGLKAALDAEHPGILAWAIQGCLDWRKHGLRRPAKMLRETEEYFASEDVFANWMEENCNLSPDSKVLSSDLLNSLNWYVRKQGRPRWTTNQFADEMKARGFFQKRTSSGNTWLEIELSFGFDLLDEDKSGKTA